MAFFMSMKAVHTSTTQNMICESDRKYLLGSTIKFSGTILYDISDNAIFHSISTHITKSLYIISIKFAFLK
jgi:hypothetical protein